MKQFLVRRLLPRILTVARAVLPRRPHVFVIGFPPTEGNAVETVRALLRWYDGTVVWAQAPSPDHLDRIGLTMRDRLRLVHKGSPLTLLRYATAELVLFTHGVYGEPAATARKPTVNLWHGAGMKLAGPLFPQRRLKSPPSDLIIAPSKVWGGQTAHFSGLSEEKMLLVGYPRNDQLFRPATSDQLAGLGVRGDFVVWLPSYRTTRPGGTMRQARDGVDIAGDQQLTSQFSTVVEILAHHDLQVVIKPHPLDSVARNVPGAVVLDDAVLEAAGIPLYAVLGAASGLISDTSSAWTDFLLMDRPIGFYFPDREEYARGRGLHPPDMLDWLPGPLLDTSDDIERFAASLSAETEDERARRSATADRGGLVRTKTSAEDLLTALRDRYPDLATRLNDSTHSTG